VTMAGRESEPTSLPTLTIFHLSTSLWLIIAEQCHCQLHACCCWLSCNLWQFTGCSWPCCCCCAGATCFLHCRACR
jgi:hypothetical protein